jgi:hypothetical protein
VATQDEIIQVRLTDTATNNKILVGDNTLISNKTLIFPHLVRKSAVQKLIDEGLVEQVPATTSIPLTAVFADIELATSKRVAIPIGPLREQDSIVRKKVNDGTNDIKVETVTPELNYYPVTLIVLGVPTEFALEFPRFSSLTDKYQDVFSFATIRTLASPTPKPLDSFDNYKNEIVLKPGQILNCRINPKIAELEAKGLITITSISTTPANIASPQTTIGPSPEGLPFPAITPTPLFQFVDFYGFVNSAPTFPIG